MVDVYSFEGKKTTGFGHPHAQLESYFPTHCKKNGRL
jgi:hypothetical protein